MDNKNQNLIGSLLISAACFLSFYFVIQTYNQVGQLRAILDERKAMLISRTDAVNKILKLKSEYQSKLGEIEKIATAIPSEKRLPELISTFESISNSSGMSLSELSISEDQTKGGELKVMNTQFKTSGSYPSFKVLLGFIESNRRIIDVDDIKLNLNKTSGDIFIEMSAHTYVLNKNAK